MKATSTGKHTTYQPFTVSITVESKEEAGKLYALFNHCKVIDAIQLSDDETGEVRRAILEQEPEARGFSASHSAALDAIVK